MPRALRSCLFWLALYGALVWGFVFVLERRMVAREHAIFGGLFGALMLILALGWLVQIGTKLRGLLTPRRGINGEEPIDGEMYAACGPIECAGHDTMVSPLTHTPAVIYAYRISSWPDRRAWQGVRLASCRIQCGNYPIRILALPRLAFDEALCGGDARTNAERWVETTSFSGEPARLFGELRPPERVLTDENGTVEWNAGDGNAGTVGKLILHEKLVVPGEVVCAVGRYSAMRGGLVPDPGARGHSIVLRKSRPESAGAAIFGSIGNVVKAAIALAIATAGLVALHTFVPLGLVEIERPEFRPSWLEVRADDMIEMSVRGRIARAGYMPELEMQPGRALAVGEARGWVTSARGDAAVVGAELRRVDETLDVLFFDAEGSLAGAIKIAKGGELVRALVLGEEVDLHAVPVATFEFGDRRDEYALPGRVSWYAKDVPSMRVRFRAGWPAEP